MYFFPLVSNLNEDAVISQLFSQQTLGVIFDIYLLDVPLPSRPTHQALNHFGSILQAYLPLSQ